MKIRLSVLIYCAAMSFAFATEKLDFRGVTPGMKVDEINSLEAVKLGYMPKIDLKGGKPLVCSKAYLKLVLNDEKHWFYPSVRPTKENIKYADEYDRWIPVPNAFMCKTEGVIFFKNAEFAVSMLFLNEQLIDLGISYGTRQGYMRYFHDALVEKFTDKDKNIILVDEKAERHRNIIVKPKTHTGRMGVSTAILRITHRNKIHFLDRFFDENPATGGDLILYNPQYMDDFKGYGEEQLADHIKTSREAMVKKASKAAKTKSQKAQQDKKYLN